MQSPEYFNKRDCNRDQGYRLDDEINQSKRWYSILIGVYYYILSYFYPTITEITKKN